MIRSIRPIDGLVLEEGGKVISPLAPIYPLDHGPKNAAGPAAFASDRKDSALLEIEVDLPRAGHYLLVGRLTGEGIRLFSGSAEATTAGPSTFRIRLDSTPTEVAALADRRIQWRLLGAESLDNIADQTLRMELYFVRRAPDLRFRKGLPLEVLRRVAMVLELQDRFVVSPVGFGYVGDLVPDLVRWLFFRNPPSYDIWNGAPHFCDPAEPNNIILFLGAYDASYTDPFAICNCYDMASLLQFYLETLGYGPIAWAFMEPFGYLRLTLLVGRGSNNSPIFGRSEGPPVLPCDDPERTAFGNHSFCYLPWEGSIADACSGPHLGNEGVDEYVAVATDDCFPVPPSVPRGTVNDIVYYRGVTRVLTTRPVAHTLASSNIGPFERAIGWRAPEDERGKTMPLLAVDWPDPRHCPQLAGWTVTFTDTTPGFPEVRRQWRLRRGDDGVVLTVHVASDDADTARSRFLATGSIHSAAEPTWQRGPGGLGEVSARSLDGSRLLWLDRTVVILLESRASDIDLPEVARWLQERVRRGNLDGTPPVIEGLDVAATVKEGAIVEARVACNAAYRVEYAGGHPGLQLLAEDGLRFTFRALRASEAELRVVVVDPSTLLSSMIGRQVEVEEG